MTSGRIPRAPKLFHPQHFNPCLLCVAYPELTHANQHADLLVNMVDLLLVNVVDHLLINGVGLLHLNVHGLPFVDLLPFSSFLFFSA